MRAAIEKFRMPRYHEITDVGLYLEQTVKYINGALAPLGCMQITASMVSNYVKSGFVPAPVKKQYYTDQIAYLFAVTIVKHVLSIEHIGKLFVMQKQIYSVEVAYDYFCMELENMLQHVFGLKDTVEHIGVTSSEVKQMLRSAIIAVANIVYLNDQFEKFQQSANLH